MGALSVKTRYGFGSDEIPPPDETAAPQRNARTVFGHQNHLPNLAAPTGKPSIPIESRITAPGSAASAAPDRGALPPLQSIAEPLRSPSSAPRKRTPVPADREQSAERNRTRRKSGVPAPKRTGPIPAVARFLGRRNTAGDIVPLREKTDIIELPARDQWVRPVVTVVAAAACSFIIVAILMWIAGTRQQPEKPATNKPQPVSIARPMPLAPKIPPPTAPAPMLETPPIILPANVAPVSRPQRPNKPISAARPFTKQPGTKPVKRSSALPVNDPDAPMSPSLL
jgi:hypothetical protein